MSEAVSGDAVAHPPSYYANRAAPWEKIPDLTGMRYGKLTVIEKAPKGGHKNARWICRCDCGNTSTPFQGNLVHDRVKSCGCSQFRPRSERVFDDKGYARIYMPDHPRAHKQSGRVLEHIALMEQHLGRYLLPGEEVHHINASRGDNRIENLELWTHSHPSGARVEDHISWAMEILKTYAPGMLNIAA